ncbi:MAG: exopolyphosphatase [Gammaproteobacteria bacterium]|nr:exopolyphosphatase [Gammaproteobacteria bacterium]
MSTLQIDGNQTLAAVDLGSNSFHMIVARAHDHGFRVVDRMRQAVRLAAGLDADNIISDKAMARALECLEQFGERVRELPRGAVRVVGTNTLRKARNSWEFITRAELALGHPIDVISGYEEARLIYLGVSHGLEDESEQRLVMDIGGGSTEFILGRHFDPLYMESLHMGCVSHSDAFFPGGRIDAKALRAAEIAARQELEAIEVSYRRVGWQSAIGASGTILAVREIVMRQGWSEEGITPQSLARLKQALVDAGHVDKLTLDGLSDERRPVLPGGVAILAATFEALGIERMRVSPSALREGLLYDLLGRLHQEDVREQTVAELVRRYQLDVNHSERVAATALALYEEAAPAWGISGEDPRRLLRWAAALHEIGLSVSHSQYQKHGEYLLSNLDMPGFARGDQRRIAALVRGHRRKFPLAELGRFPPEQVTLVRRLCVLLRIACVLHRRRSEEAVPPLALKADGDSLKLGFPDGWLGGHPLTRADLESEAGYLKAAGIKLKIK